MVAQSPAREAVHPCRAPRRGQGRRIDAASRCFGVSILIVRFG